ncbi:MAG: hypothetical protein WD928_05550 [Gammaproteobacteria bacterium]
MKFGISIPTFVDAPGERAPDERRSLKGTVEEIRTMVQGYAAAGVEEIVIDANSQDLDATLASYARFRAEIIPSLRA